MYGPDNIVDKRGLKATLSYNALSGGRYDPDSLGGLSDEEFEHAVTCGMLYRPNRVWFDHDTAVAELRAAVDSTDLRHQVDLFLASLSTHRLDYRFGLGALAIARNLPLHGFDAPREGTNCTVCKMTIASNVLDRNSCSMTRFRVGAPIHLAPPALTFYLSWQQQLRPTPPAPADFAIFAAILQSLIDTPPDETAKRLPMRQMKSISGFKSRTEERQLLLETLGYCGILETKKHGDMLHRYVHPSFAPRKTHSSDWRYPVDFWTGKDGLNQEAFKFWFGTYPELARFP